MCKLIRSLRGAVSDAMTNALRGALGITLGIALALSFVTTAAVAQDDHPAQLKVMGVVNSMLQLYQEEGDRLTSDPEFLQSKIDELIVPNIDFESMTKLAVSKHWRQADANQRKDLVKEFTQLLLGTYTDALVEYGGDSGEENVTFEAFRADRRDDRAVVRSNFKQATSSDVPVWYKLANLDGDSWRIYDIVVDDSSLVTLYRSGFASEIEKGGIDGLINLMKKRNGNS